MEAKIDLKELYKKIIQIETKLSDVDKKSSDTNRQFTRYVYILIFLMTMSIFKQYIFTYVFLF